MPRWPPKPVDLMRDEKITYILKHKDFLDKQLKETIAFCTENKFVGFAYIARFFNHDSIPCLPGREEWNSDDITLLFNTLFARRSF